MIVPERTQSSSSVRLNTKHDLTLHIVGTQFELLVASRTITHRNSRHLSQGQLEGFGQTWTHTHTTTFSAPCRWFCSVRAVPLLLGYRYAYIKLVGRHKPPPVQISFTLQNLNTDEAFAVIRNPRLLDETTPFWFRLVIRKHSVEAINDFLAKSEPKVMLSKEAALKIKDDNGKHDKLQLPLYFDYWDAGVCFAFSMAK